MRAARLQLAILVACACLAGGLTREVQGAEHRPASDVFKFAVLGDIPFSAREEADVADVLTAAVGAGSRFIVHVGDIRGPSEACSDELFEIRKTLLDSSAKPLILLPGANDWLGCDGSAGGGSEAQERLARLRERLFDADESLGVEKMPLARQSGVARFHEFSENVRWGSGEVLFVGVNVPSPNNDYRVAGGRNSEFEDRMVANRAWLERAFAYAQMHHLPGIAIFCQADPNMNRSIHALDGRGSRRDGFYEFKSVVRDLAEKFHGEVLLVHGPLANAAAGGIVEDVATREIKNLMEVRAFGSPESRRWIEITVDVHRQGVFFVAPAKLGETTAVEGTPPRQP